MAVEEMMTKYFADLNGEDKSEVAKFLFTLKWTVLREDIEYSPPENLGSKYTLAVYALLRVGFSVSDIKKLVEI